MKHIPNLLTLANAICGMMAIYFIVNSSSTGLVIALLSAATFDALDGWAARKVGAFSALGKQLDSLADAISFGAVSGFIWSSILADYARMSQPWAMLIGAMVTAINDSSTYADFDEAFDNPGDEFHVVGVLNKDKSTIYEPEIDPDKFMFYMLDVNNEERKIEKSQISV